MKALFTALTALLMIVAMPAQAYVGPGAGITLIGSLIGLVGAVLIALWAVISWPMKNKGKKGEGEEAEAEAEVAEAEAAQPEEKS